jgi:hypothetical protein
MPAGLCLLPAGKQICIIPSKNKPIYNIGKSGSDKRLKTTKMQRE